MKHGLIFLFIYLCTYLLIYFCIWTYNFFIIFCQKDNSFFIEFSNAFVRISWQCLCGPPSWLSICSTLYAYTFALSYDPIIQLLGLHSKEIKIHAHTKTFTWMFITAKQPKRGNNTTFINWWPINNMWYNHKMEYYLAIKRNEAVINATALIILENILLRERSQL